MNTVLETIIVLITAMLASSGMWAFLSKKLDKRDVQTEMLIGLAHDRIMFLGMSYIERGYITQDEYENLDKYLYKPYKKLGGNGSAEHVMAEVNKLPIKRKIQ
jgi:hypothetical protein